MSTATKTRMACVNCGKPGKRFWHNRSNCYCNSRFCWKCANDPAIRRAFPGTSKFAPGDRSLWPCTGAQPESRLPETPTDAPPGTERKIEVLAQRFKRGESLWHPLDAGHEARGDPFAALLIAQSRAVAEEEEWD